MSLNARYLLISVCNTNIQLVVSTCIIAALHQSYYIDVNKNVFMCYYFIFYQDNGMTSNMSVTCPWTDKVSMVIGLLNRVKFHFV